MRRVFFDAPAVPRGWAELRPHGLFRDNAVLQRDAKLPVLGTTDKPERVTVSFAGQEASVEPKDGKWHHDLASLKASAEPRSMRFSKAMPFWN